VKNYIGFKVVKAEPMNLGDYNKFRGWTIPANENPEKEGYKIVYPDGYVSWSPKEIFDQAYLEVDPNPKLKSEVSVSPKMVDEFIKEVHTSTLGEKTTLVRVVLVNGFEIIEASACVDPANYDEKMGEQICLKKIKDKIWGYLGFLLQTAVNGVK
jgi:hypothetical protein